MLNLCLIRRKFDHIECTCLRGISCPFACCPLAAMTCVYCSLQLSSEETEEVCNRCGEEFFGHCKYCREAAYGPARTWDRVAKRWLRSWERARLRSLWSLRRRRLWSLRLRRLWSLRLRHLWSVCLRRLWSLRIQSLCLILQALAVTTRWATPLALVGSLLQFCSLVAMSATILIGRPFRA